MEMEYLLVVHIVVIRVYKLVWDTIYQEGMDRTPGLESLIVGTLVLAMAGKLITEVPIMLTHSTPHLPVRLELASSSNSIGVAKPPADYHKRK